MTVTTIVVNDALRAANPLIVALLLSFVASCSPDGAERYDDALRDDEPGRRVDGELNGTWSDIPTVVIDSDLDEKPVCPVATIERILRTTLKTDVTLEVRDCDGNAVDGLDPSGIVCIVGDDDGRLAFSGLGGDASWWSTSDGIIVEAQVTVLPECRPEEVAIDIAHVLGRDDA